MNNSKRALMALLIIISLSLPALSQEKADKEAADKDKQQAANAGKLEDKSDKDPGKLWVDLSGVMFLEWAYLTGFNNTGVAWGKTPRWGVEWTDPAVAPVPVQPVNYSYKKDNTFRMQRAYLTLKKQLGDMFSVKITTDINPTGQDFIYLKYGFVQFYKDFLTPYGPISLKAQLGKIGTPVIGLTDYLNDLRWIGPNYLNASKYVLNGKSYDDSADLGGLVSLNLFRLATLEYSYTNGEGFKFDNSEVYSGKAHTLMLSANPVEYLKELYVNAYARWENTDKSNLETGNTVIKYSGINKRTYYGCGIAWYSDLIKAGVNFFAPTTEVSKTLFIYPVDITRFASRHIIKSYLVDSWLNLNLGAVTPAGILFIGRCAYGVELKSLLGNSRELHETLVLGGGLGYQINQHFRMALYYETYRYRVGTKLHYITQKDPTANNNVYIKVEAKY